MQESRERVYVGFGLGAIQAGLFLYEGQEAQAFDRAVVAEVLPEVVARVRANGNRFSVNIAHADRVEVAAIGPVSIENPSVAEDRARLIDAIAVATEMGTAVPSVDFYARGGDASIASLLAAGLRRKAAKQGPRAVIYTAENNNHAAERLEEAVMDCIPAEEQAAVKDRARFLNTVIGKMSGIITDQETITSRGLAAFTPGEERACLVEAFNAILITAIDFPGESFARGIKVFEEKDDLLPFEEAKLYGHNAVHAMGAYLGRLRGASTMADLRERTAVMAILHEAFIAESGAALLRKYYDLDPLFTEEGFRVYAEDLLDRMTNPHLADGIERVGRDPERKLGWNDRLIGTLRLVLDQGIEPGLFARGAAAAVLAWKPGALDDVDGARAALRSLWESDGATASESEEIAGRIVNVFDWVRAFSQ